MSGEPDLRVVIVDDDFMVADIHRRLVEREEGFSVVAVVGTAREAVEAVAAHRPDLVLLDIYLPDASGLEVLARLRAQRIPADVLVITAANDFDTLRDALRQGTVHYLIKPFDVGVLSERLRTYQAYRRQTIRPERSDAAEVEQRDVDQAISALRPARPPVTLPKGLSTLTMELVVDVVSSGSGAPRTATEVGAAAGISRVAARRYLEHLVTTGALEARPRYGGTGRPEIEYRQR